jgi:peroxiredoxin
VSAPELLRKIDIREAHANSIICLLPGMYDIRLEIRDEMWRAGWGQVNGGEFCQNALDALARNLHTIRARGLSLAIISGLAIPDKPVKELGVDLICDPDASFARLLDLSPLRYQGQEFLPRVAMLVRDGEIVSAFSETENFEAALNNLLALTQKSPNNSTQPPKASSNSQASRETPPSEKSTPMKEEQPRSTGEQPNVAQSATSESAPRVDTPGTKTAPPEKTLVPAPVLSAKPILSAYTDTDTLIGKKLAHSPVFRTARNNSGAWYRDEVLADKEFKSAVITIIPGPIDWKLVKDGQEQRAFWEAIPGVSTCASDLKILGETAPVLERKGLQAVLIAGPEYLYSLTTLVQSYPKLSVVSDYRGNFARGLNITPMPLWDQEFSPRLTLLVRDGKIEKAFSETADFRKSLAEMLSSVPDRIEPVQTAPVKPPTEQAAPKKLLGRKFDITKLDMKSPLPEGRALGQHPLLKADPYIPTPYAFQIALARGMEKVREEIGELPREYRMSVTISNGYRAFSYLVEPADIAANGDISRALLNQTASKNRSLSYLLTQLSSNASRLGLRLKVSANGDSNMDFEFMSNVPRYTPSLRLEIIKR